MGIGWLPTRIHLLSNLHTRVPSEHCQSKSGPGFNDLYLSAAFMTFVYLSAWSLICNGTLVFTLKQQARVLYVSSQLFIQNRVYVFSLI